MSEDSFKGFHKIKACPFCGGRARLEVHRFLPNAFGVRCTKCSAMTWPFGNEEEALRAWNTRTDEGGEE